MLGRWNDVGKEQKMTKISLISLTSEAQLRQETQEASGEDSTTHGSVKGNFGLLRHCLRSSANKGIKEGKEENVGARDASEGGDRGVMEVD